MKKVMAVISGLMIMLSATANAAEFETWYAGAESGLNLRSEPNADSAVITVYPHGTELSVIGTDGGKWWQVWDGINQGWVSSEYMVDSADKYAEPQPQIGEYLGVFRVTGYTPDPAENGGGTVDCFGVPLELEIGDIVAVDASVIPLNTWLYIEGVGYRKTHDTGVYGRVIDVLTASNYESDMITADRNVYIVEGVE